MSEQRVLCGLDIGTTKATALVADVTDPEAPKLVGVGTAPSDGLRRGVVVDLDRTTHRSRTRGGSRRAHGGDQDPLGGGRDRR